MNFDIKTVEGLICAEDFMVGPPEERGDCGPCIWTSGLVVSDFDAQEVANSNHGGTTVQFRKPLSLDAAPIVPVTNFDEGAQTTATGAAIPDCDCDTICYGSYRVRRDILRKCLTDNDISRFCSTVNQKPEEFIPEMMEEYWIRSLENRALVTIDGIMLDNIANDDGDMVVDVRDAGTDPLVDNPNEEGVQEPLFNFATHVAAENQLICSSSNISGIIMHTNVFANLRRRENARCEMGCYNLTTTAGQRVLNITPTNVYRYMGYDVFVCNNPNLVDLTDPANPIYKTYYFGQGVMHYGRTTDESTLGFPRFETDRDACRGQTKWFFAEGGVLHPAGYSALYAGDACSTVVRDSDFMDLDDLVNPLNWDRRMQRTNIPLVAAYSRG